MTTKKRRQSIVAMLFGILILPALFWVSDVQAQRGGTNGTGEWGPIIELPLIPVGAANLPNGQLLIWAAHDEQDFGGNRRPETEAAIFNPANNRSAHRTVTETEHDMFCPGTSNLIDGRILINGGRSSEKTSIYNYANDSWDVAENMSIPRGYQANTVLSDGSVFTIGGSWSGGRGGKDAEIWTDSSGWSLVSGIPVDPILDGISDPQGVYRSDNHAWIWAAPNGKIFHAGPSTQMHWFDTSGNGSHTRAGTRGDDDSAMSGTTVMYDVGKILKVGGSTSYSSGDPASGATYIIDINSNTPAVEKVDNLRLPRSMHNSVVLPTGEVLVIGGIRNADIFEDDDTRLIAELWNPESKQWRDVDEMQVSRTYHSTAILLPDGRVFAGGGGLCGNCAANHLDAEIYSPPYLFDGNRAATRPVINSSPGSAEHGETISVRTNSSVDAFSLIRLSSVTHSTNNDQRRIPLTPINAGSNRYNLTIPSNANVVLPGYYMLFAMNADGTPSVSKTIQINLATTPPSSNGGTRYVRLVADSDVTDGFATSVAEFNVLDNNGNIISRAGWRISASSDDSGYEPAKAIDDQNDTFWHTEFRQANTPHPHEIIIDMRNDQEVGGFTYLPRQTNSQHGTIADYRFYVSTDGNNWGSPVAQGTFANNKSEKRVRFDTPSSSSGQIVNTRSGKCVEAAGGGTTNRTNIQQGTCNGSAGQQWETVLGNGGFMLRNPNSDKCIDVSRVSKDNGANVWLFTCLGTDNQTLTLDGAALKFKHSSKCLDFDGNNIQQDACNGNDGQSFSLGEDVAETPITLNMPAQIINHDTGECVEVAGGGTARRANIQQGTCDGSAKQLWEAVPANGGFMLRNPNSDKCIDVSRVSKDNGANVWLWTCLNTDNQILTGQGTALKFKHSGKCLDPDGDNIEQDACNGNDKQSFSIGATVVAMDTSAMARSGDVGCNGNVDSTDALLILQYDVGMRNGEEQCTEPARQERTIYLPACDLNGDDKCSSVDALWVLQCDIGIDNPSCPNDELESEFVETP